ncbi:Potassium voltage-gated channel subfamily D member 2 [Symbiodinium microadriaticum]|uniref:Potassium voltage-gated channel subfamily D member 2 n=1 Tax=Symbiodinium microadriaticum TaxID=2951 RepID=A0A1Q9D2S8_SYMMI|nr:Potassium voltage-gated channel subfamily D member 2 [Symbiodinium microadriaticum]CAE7286964.1 Kcnd2 [Symbiodinium sp. KB8]
MAASSENLRRSFRAQRSQRSYVQVEEADTSEEQEVNVGRRCFWMVLNIVSCATVIFSISATVILSVPRFATTTSLHGSIEVICSAFFVFEYVLRLCASRRPLVYAFSCLGVVDLVVAAGSLPTLIIRLTELVQGRGHVHFFHPLLPLRMLRLLKLYYLPECRQLCIALKGVARFIMVFLLGVLVIVLMLGSCLYVAEDGHEGFESIPAGMWWATVTITTVGYGDAVPQTVLGKMFASLSMLIGYGMLAIPTLLGAFSIGRSEDPRNKSRASQPAETVRLKETILWSDADTPEGLVPVQIRPADCDDFGYLKHAAGFSLLEQAVVQWSSADARYLTWPVKDYWFHVPLSGRDSSRSLWAEVTRSGDLLSLSSCEFRVSFYSTFRSNSTETPVARGSIRYGQENSEKSIGQPRSLSVRTAPNSPPRFKPEAPLSRKAQPMASSATQTVRSAVSKIISTFTDTGSVRDRYVSLASPDDLHHTDKSQEFVNRKFWLTLNLLSICIVVVSVILTVVMSLPEVRSHSSYTRMYDVVEMACAAFFIVEPRTHAFITFAREQQRQ